MSTSFRQYLAELDRFIYGPSNCATTIYALACDLIYRLIDAVFNLYAARMDLGDCDRWTRVRYSIVARFERHVSKNPTAVVVEGIPNHKIIK